MLYLDTCKSLQIDLEIDAGVGFMGLNLAKIVLLNVFNNEIIPDKTTVSIYYCWLDAIQ